MVVLLFISFYVPATEDAEKMQAYWIAWARAQSLKAQEKAGEGKQADGLYHFHIQ